MRLLCQRLQPAWSDYLQLASPTKRLLEEQGYRENSESLVLRLQVEGRLMQTITNTNALIPGACIVLPLGKDAASKAAVDSRLRGNDKKEAGMIKKKRDEHASLFKAFVLITKRRLNNDYLARLL